MKFLNINAVAVELDEINKLRKESNSILETINSTSTINHVNMVLEVNRTYDTKISQCFEKLRKFHDIDDEKDLYFWANRVCKLREQFIQLHNRLEELECLPGDKSGIRYLKKEMEDILSDIERA